MRKGVMVVVMGAVLWANAAWAQDPQPAAPAPAAAAPTAPAAKVVYPKGYRDWKHVKSMVIFDKKHPLFDAFGGIHHVYVNDKALKALKNKTEYPRGAAFAFDLLEATESSGAYAEGKRKFMAVMVRDAKKFKETEGWGWQAWEGGDPGKPVLKGAADQKACATCHKEVGAKGFVFTEWRP
jgi:hypothetical protein